MVLEAMYGSMHKGADDRPTEQWRSVTASNGPMIKYFTIAPTINYLADFKSAYIKQIAFFSTCGLKQAPTIFRGNSQP